MTNAFRLRQARFLKACSLNVELPRFLLKEARPPRREPRFDLLRPIEPVVFLGGNNLLLSYAVILTGGCEEGMNRLWRFREPGSFKRIYSLDYTLLLKLT